LGAYHPLINLEGYTDPDFWIVNLNGSIPLGTGTAQNRGGDSQHSAGSSWGFKAPIKGGVEYGTLELRAGTSGGGTFASDAKDGQGGGMAEYWAQWNQAESAWEKLSMPLEKPNGTIGFESMKLYAGKGGQGGQNSASYDGGDGADGASWLLDFQDSALVLNTGGNGNGIILLEAGDGGLAGIDTGGHGVKRAGSGGDGGHAGIWAAKITGGASLSMKTGNDAEESKSRGSGAGFGEAGDGGNAYLIAHGTGATQDDPAVLGLIELGYSELTVNDGSATISATGGSDNIGYEFDPEPGTVSAAGFAITLAEGRRGALLIAAEGGGVNSDLNGGEAAPAGTIEIGDMGLTVSLGSGHGDDNRIQAVGGTNDISGKGAAGMGSFTSGGPISVFSHSEAEVAAASKLTIGAYGGENGVHALSEGGNANFKAYSIDISTGGAIDSSTGGSGGGSVTVESVASSAVAHTDDTDTANYQFAGGDAELYVGNDSGSGDIKLEVKGSSAGNLSVRSIGGDGAGHSYDDPELLLSKGGSAKITAGNISLKTSSGEGAGTATVEVSGGSSPYDGDGGEATLEAGRISIDAGSGDSLISVSGGASKGLMGKGPGGMAVLSAGDIGVSSSAIIGEPGGYGSAYLSVNGGGGSKGAAGVLHSYGTVTVTVNNPGVQQAGKGKSGISVTGGSSDIASGGDATMNVDGGLAVTGLSGTVDTVSQEKWRSEAFVMVQGGDSFDAFDAGDATLNAGDVAVTSGNVRAGVYVLGGDANNTFNNRDGITGTAHAIISSLSLTSGTAEASFLVMAGQLEKNGFGSSASLTVQSDVTVTSLTGNAILSVASSSDFADTDQDGHDIGAYFQAGNVSVRATGDGDATVRFRGGGTAVDHSVYPGGSVTANMLSLDVMGATDDEGSAFFGAIPGNMLTPFTGHTSLNVVGTLSVTGGGAANGVTGGEAQVAFDKVQARTVRVVSSSTVTSGSTKGRAALIARESLDAETITVHRNKAYPGQILPLPAGEDLAQSVLYAGELVLEDHDTTINLVNTVMGNAVDNPWGQDIPGPWDASGIGLEGTPATGVYIGMVSFAHGNKLHIHNLEGQIAIGSLEVGDGEKAGIEVDDSSNASIGSLTARNSPRFTVSVPDGFAQRNQDGGTVLAIGGDVDLSGSELYIDKIQNLNGIKGKVTFLKAGGTLTGPDTYASAASADYPIEFTVEDDSIVAEIDYSELAPTDPTDPTPTPDPDPDPSDPSTTPDDGDDTGSQDPNQDDPDTDAGDGTEIAGYAAAGVKRIVKSYAEGAAAATAFVNAGSDLAAGEGIANAVTATKKEGLSLFTASSYGSSRYETGSHVDVKGISMLLGGAYGFDVSPGRVTLGAFLELGDGSYDSYNGGTLDGSGALDGGEARGSGGLKYVGGGILLRYDFSGNYVEFTGRFGRSSMEISSEDWSALGILPGGAGTLDSTYYGLHLGYGHVFALSKSVSLDLSLKYLYTHLEGGDILSPQAGMISLSDVDSHRLRLGARLSVAATGMIKPFFGLYYEHELNGRADAAAGGVSLQGAPALKGGTGIGELGLAFGAADGLTIEAAVKGYIGVRRGFSATLSLIYNF
jgi:hypothetical protein